MKTFREWLSEKELNEARQNISWDILIGGNTFKQLIRTPEAVIRTLQSTKFQKEKGDKKIMILRNITKIGSNTAIPNEDVTDHFSDFI